MRSEWGRVIVVEKWKLMGLVYIDGDIDTIWYWVSDGKIRYKVKDYVAEFEIQEEGVDCENDKLGETIRIAGKYFDRLKRECDKYKIGFWWR